MKKYKMSAKNKKSFMMPIYLISKSTIMYIFIILMSFFTISSILFSYFSKNNLFGMVDIKNVLIVIVGVTLLFLYVYLVLKMIKKFSIQSNKIRNISLLVLTSFAIVIFAIYSNMGLITDPVGTIKYPIEYEVANKFYYQLPLMLFNGTLVKYLGLDYAIVAFRLMNVCLLILSFYFMGKITKEMFGEKVANIFYIISPLCFQFIFYLTFVYGTFPSACIMIIVLYQVVMFIRDNNTYRIPVIIILSLISLSLRLNTQITLLAILLVLLLRVVKLLSIKEYKMTVKPAILSACIFIMLVAITPVICFIGNTIQNKYKIKAMSPLMSFSQGLAAYDEDDKREFFNRGGTQQQLNDMIGSYSDVINAHETIGKYGVDGSKVIISKRLNYRVNEFIKNPKMALKFFLRKTLSNWASPDFLAIENDMDKRIYGEKTKENKEMHPEYNITIDNGGVILKWLMIHPEGKDSKLFSVIKNFQDMFESFVYLFSLVGIISLRKKIKLAFLILPTCVIGQFCFSIISEGRAIYHWPYFVLLLPYAALGVSVLYKKIVKSNSKTTD